MLAYEFFRKFLLSARAGAVVRRISWLCILSIAVSLASLIIVISVMLSLNQNITDRIWALEPHLNITLPGVKDLALIGQSPVAQYLATLPNMRVFPYESQDVIIRTSEGRFRGGVARGLNNDSLKFFLNEFKRINKNSYGWSGEVDELQLKAGEILMGVDLAQMLGVFEGDAVMVLDPEGLLLPPGESPRFERLIVKKILATNLSDVDSRYIYFLQGKTLGLMRTSASRNMGLEVRMDHPDQATELKEKLLPFVSAQVETWKDRNSALFFALKGEKIVIGLFLSIAALIASFSMISVITLLISQKKKDIGILLAVGFSGGSVRKLFTQIGLMLSGIGIVAGLIAGLAVSLYLHYNPMKVLPDMVYYDSDISAEVNPWFILTVVLAACLVAVVGARLSARAASQHVPSDLLRGRG